MGRVTVRSEQIHVAAMRRGGGFVVGSRQYTGAVPWHDYARCFIYGLSLEVLEALLEDAVRGGYQVVSGYHSDRRGLRGFTLGIGAHGHRGHVRVQTVDAWALDPLSSGCAESNTLGMVEWCQGALRQLCRRLNQEQTPFRPSAYRWLSGLYDRMGAPLEPGDRVANLPESVALLCRAAHVGGPIIHARTELRPYVSLDRKRAYGNAMLKHLPAGQAAEVKMGSGPAVQSLHRWRPNDLMKMFGVAEATVKVHEGPFISLLPVLQQASRFDRARTIYPLGRFRGSWCLHELAYLEESGRGRVEQLHQVVVFQQRPVLASIIRYLRRIEDDLPILVKRLEHILYGKCARSLGMCRIGSVTRMRAPMPSDLLDPRATRRVRGSVSIRPYGLRSREGQAVRHPLYKAVATMSPVSEWGSVDRPDRAAWIVATNRIAMSRVIDALDHDLGASRSGEFVGRVYVDGLDIEASLDDVAKVMDAEVRRSGPSMRIYRSGAFVARTDEGAEVVEGAGLIAHGSTSEQLLAAIRQSPDIDGGPFAGGRSWTFSSGVADPRMLSGQASEPLVVTPDVMNSLGFGRGL